MPIFSSARHSNSSSRLPRTAMMRTRQSTQRYTSCLLIRTTSLHLSLLASSTARLTTYQKYGYSTRLFHLNYVLLRFRMASICSVFIWRGNSTRKQRKLLWSSLPKNNEQVKSSTMPFFNSLYDGVYFLGNYRDAHNLLQHMYRELNSHEINIPLEMERNLQLLHSYVIVRLHIRLGRHLNAARLLLRVADSISRFPSRKYTFGRL